MIKRGNITMYSKYIKALIRDYRTMNPNSFVDKYGYEAQFKARKLSNEQYNIERIDAQVKRATINARKVY